MPDLNPVEATSTTFQSYLSDRNFQFSSLRDLITRIKDINSRLKGTPTSDQFDKVSNKGLECAPYEGLISDMLSGTETLGQYLHALDCEISDLEKVI